MRDELLALLEDGPHPTDELAEWLSADAGAVALELAGMKDAGLVRRINAAGERCWALAGYVTPAPASRVPRQPRTHHRTSRQPEQVPAAAPSVSVSPSGRMTRIINGEEYEVVWDGSRGAVTEDWPDGSATESVFSGPGVRVSR